MASDIDRGANFYNTPYKNNQKRDLIKSKRGEEYFIFF